MRYAFGSYVLDPAQRELSRDGVAVHVEPQVFNLLHYLIQNRSRVVSKEDVLSELCQGRAVSDSTLYSRINAARAALQDSGDRQEFIRTIPKRGLRFVGQIREELASPVEPVLTAMSAPSAESASRQHALAGQKVTFCRTADGLHLAVATNGNGPPLVKAANWLNHLEYDWQSPVWSPSLRLLASQFRLVRYDERGTGLSDWTADEISFEAFVSDLETVVDSLGLDRFALLGISQGAAVSVAYAARHPQRVSRLILCGGYAKGWRNRSTPEEIVRREAMLTLIRHGWGQDSPVFRQIFTSILIPDATSDQTQSFNELERVSSSPENAARLADVLAPSTFPTCCLKWLPQRSYSTAGTMPQFHSSKD